MLINELDAPELFPAKVRLFSLIYAFTTAVNFRNPGEVLLCTKVILFIRRLYV